MRRQQHDGVGAVDRGSQVQPLGLAVSHRREGPRRFSGAGRRRADALPATESPASGGPFAQFGERGEGLLEDECLDLSLVGQPEVNEQLSERPRSEFGLLRLACLGKIRGGQPAAGDQSGADGFFGAGHDHVADGAVAQCHRGFRATDGPQAAR